MPIRLSECALLVSTESLCTTVEDAVNRCLADEEVGIILITRPLCELCGDFITQTKRSYDKPLIVEIPDRHGSQGSDSIARYVRDTIGIKI